MKKMKKNKKGFSIIEILGVLILLSLILVITIPVIEKNVKNSNINSLNTIKGNIISATKNWAADNAKLLPNDSNSSITITLGMLKQGNYVDNNIYNPVEKKNISNETRIRIEKVEEYYNYTLDDIISNIDNETFDRPYIILKNERELNIPVNTNYIEYGAVAYYNGVERPCNTMYYDTTNNNDGILIENIDTTLFKVDALDNYKRKYKAVYSYENIKAERNINIVDTQPPIVEFINNRIENGIYYHPQGAVFNIDNIGLKIKDNSCGLDGTTTTVNNCSFLTIRPHDYITSLNNVNPNEIGNYKIKYNIRDAKGNINNAVLNVKVENYDPILVNGSDANENVEVNTAYVFKTMNIRRHAKTGGEVVTLTKFSPDSINTSIVGSTANVIYKYTDPYTIKNYEFKKIVKVVDTTEPVMLLDDERVSGNIMKVYLGTSNEHIKFKITDNSCGTTQNDTTVNDCNNTLKATPNISIDTSIVRTYDIIYTAKDKSNNSTNKTIKIDVVDNIAPIITIALKHGVFYNTNNQTLNSISFSTPANSGSNTSNIEIKLGQKNPNNNNLMFLKDLVNVSYSDNQGVSNATDINSLNFNSVTNGEKQFTLIASDNSSNKATLNIKVVVVDPIWSDYYENKNNIPTTNDLSNPYNIYRNKEQQLKNVSEFLESEYTSLKDLTLSWTASHWKVTTNAVTGDISTSIFESGIRKVTSKVKATTVNSEICTKDQQWSNPNFSFKCDATTEIFYTIKAYDSSDNLIKEVKVDISKLTGVNEQETLIEATNNDIAKVKYFASVKHGVGAAKVVVFKISYNKHTKNPLYKNSWEDCSGTCTTTPTRIVYSKQLN